MSRPLYAVIAASVADIEQREILSGIIKTAKESDIDIAVISNIYNPVDPSDILKTENKIYDLILTGKYNGFILISESILNSELQEQIRNALKKKKDIPVIVIGTPLTELMLPDFHVINTSDTNDVEEITDHLIDVHGFKNIHILTGRDTIVASHKRVDGYKRSLEKHNIPFVSNNVFYGDYWMSSGYKLAEKYINGEILFPEALVCANDYMAYGVLDECMKQDIVLPDKFSLIGYEYIRERRNHTPLLTTYQRNRKALGIQAVRLMQIKIETGTWMEKSPPRGQIIKGDSCPCGAISLDIKREINDVQTKATYDFLNLFSQLDHHLTECRSISEFVSICRDFQYMIRNVGRLYMCLYENWYKNEPPSDIMTAYNLLICEAPITFRKENFSTLFGGNSAPYYFSPLFVAEHELGFVILSYNSADTYDHIYRNWLKSIANGLEFLRMKNDIKYLTDCQNLTEFRDVTTGMLNEKGLANAYITADKSNLHLVAVQTALCTNEKISLNASGRLNSILHAAEAVREFCHNQDICAKLENNTFICLFRSSYNPEHLTDLLKSVILQNKDYIQQCGSDSFACCAFSCSEMTFAEITERYSKELKEHADIIREHRCNKYYKTLITLRDYIYLNPNDTFDSVKVHSHFDGSDGHLRSIYKKCFGVSFHQDCINARIAKARYYLAIKQYTTNQTSDVCGYAENKYFMRQFLAETGITANKYRRL